MILSFNACKMKRASSVTALQSLFGCILEYALTVEKSLSTEIFLKIWKQVSVSLVPGQENVVNAAFLQMRI